MTVARRATPPVGLAQPQGYRYPHVSLLWTMATSVPSEDGVGKDAIAAPAAVAVAAGGGDAVGERTTVRTVGEGLGGAVGVGVGRSAVVGGTACATAGAKPDDRLIAQMATATQTSPIAMAAMANHWPLLLSVVGADGLLLVMVDWLTQVCPL